MILIAALMFIVPGSATMAACPFARQLDFWERLFLALFIGILVVSWVGIILAETGMFSVPLLTAVILAYSSLALLLRRRNLHLGWLGFPKADWTSLLLVGILALAGWAFSRPAEVVAGTFDPGIYLSTGATISQHGSIAFTDHFISQMDPVLRPFLLEQRTETGVAAVRLPAFWMPQAHEDTVVPAFFHLFPVWLAIFHSLGGLQSALFVSPLFGLMGVWALFLLGRRLGGPGIGLLAAALLAVNPAQVWFARYPISEATIQVLLLGGLTLLVYMQHYRSQFLAVVAGTALGLTHLVKVDQVFVPVAIGTMLFGTWLLERPNRPANEEDVSKPNPEVPLARLYIAVAIPYALLLGHSALHMYIFSYAYTWINFSPFLPALRSAPAITGYILVYVVLASAVIFKARMVRAWIWLMDHSSRWTASTALLVATLSVYGYFIWPLSAEPNASVFLSSDGVTPVYMNLFREQGLVRLGWYLTPLGLALGLAGFAQSAGRTARAGATPILVVFILQTILYLLTAGMAYPVQFWAMRRYVPLVIPVFLLFAAFAVFGVYGRARNVANESPAPQQGAQEFDAPRERIYWRTIRHVTAALLGAIMLVSSFLTTTNFLWQTEYQDALEGLQRWASRMEDPAVVLFKPRMEGNIFSAPLQNFFGKTAFVLQSEMQEPLFSAGVQQWLSEGKNVYLALSDRYPQHISGKIEYRLAEDMGLHFYNMEQSTDHVPEKQVLMSFPLRLYRLLPIQGYPYHLDLGPLVLDQALSLHLEGAAAPAFDIAFRAKTTGPMDSSLSIHIDGEATATLPITSDMSTFSVRLPARPARTDHPVEISLAATESFSSGSGGIMLEWVEVAEASTY